MSGNIKVENLYGEIIKPDQIDLIDFNISRLRETISEFCLTINKDLKNSLWLVDDIENGYIYNGSTRVVLNPCIPANDILQFKTVLNDIDIMFSKRLKGRLLEYFSDKQNKLISKDIIYVGLSEKALKKYDCISCIFKIFNNSSSKFYNVQIDFIACDFLNQRPTDFSIFSNYSSLEDLKEGIKGLHHNKIISALAFAIDNKTDKGIIVTPKELQPRKNDNSTIVMYTWQENKGLVTNFKPALVKREQLYIDNKPCYIETEYKTSKDIKEIIKTLFKISYVSDEVYKKAWSFIGLVDMINQFLTSEEKELIINYYFNSLWGDKAKLLNKKNNNLDFIIKHNAFSYLYKKLMDRTLSIDFIEPIKKYYLSKEINNVK